MRRRWWRGGFFAGSSCMSGPGGGRLVGRRLGKTGSSGFRAAQVLGVFFGRFQPLDFDSFESQAQEAAEGGTGVF